MWGQAQKNCVIPQKNCVIFQKTKTGCGDRTALKLTWAQKNCEQFLETQLEQSQNYYSAKKLRIVFKNQSRIRPIWVLHLHYKAHYGKNFSKNFWRNSILFTQVWFVLYDFWSFGTIWHERRYLWLRKS